MNTIPESVRGKEANGAPEASLATRVGHATLDVLRRVSDRVGAAVGFMAIGAILEPELLPGTQKATPPVHEQ